MGPLFSIFWQFLRRYVLFSRPFFGPFLAFVFFFFGFLPLSFAASFGAFVFDFLLFPAFVYGIILRPLSVAFFGAFVFDFLSAFYTVCFLHFFGLLPLFLSFFNHGCTADP